MTQWVLQLSSHLIVLFLHTSPPTPRFHRIFWIFPALLRYHKIVLIKKLWFFSWFWVVNLVKQSLRLCAVIIITFFFDITVFLYKDKNPVMWIMTYDPLETILVSLNAQSVSTSSLCAFYFCRLIVKPTFFWCFRSSACSIQPVPLPSHGVLLTAQIQSREYSGNILTKTAALRIILNIDGASTGSRSHTHPSLSQTSLLLTSSLSLGVSVPHTTQCIRGVYISQFQLLVSHFTDTLTHVFSDFSSRFISSNKQKNNLHRKLVTCYDAELCVNLNIDGTPIPSRSHTHPSYSQTSRLLSSSISLGLPFPRSESTQCVWGF